MNPYLLSDIRLLTVLWLLYAVFPAYLDFIGRFFPEKAEKMQKLREEKSEELVRNLSLIREILPERYIFMFVCLPYAVGFLIDVFGLLCLAFTFSVNAYEMCIILFFGYVFMRVSLRSALVFKGFVILHGRGRRYAIIRRYVSLYNKKDLLSAAAIYSRLVLSAILLFHYL